MCPYAEGDDLRCQERLTVRNLDYAMECCAGNYERCPIYREKACTDNPLQPRCLVAG
ncbi:MAG: hypothetical protein GX591_10405 [Planctomycetes bacterium]|nr:hypothetical protein [Planctomycetota bacterium]